MAFPIVVPMTNEVYELTCFSSSDLLKMGRSLSLCRWLRRSHGDLLKWIALLSHRTKLLLASVGDAMFVLVCVCCNVVYQNVCYNDVDARMGKMVEEASS